MSILNNNSFNFTITNEGGYPRLYVTHPEFKGRIKKRIGKSSVIADQSFIYQLKFDFDRHFSKNEITKQAVSNFVDQYVSLKIKGNASIFDFFDEFVELKKETKNKLTKKLIVSTTITAYKTAKESFEDFLLKKKIPPHPNCINDKLLNDYYYSLSVSDNTKVKMHGKVKSFINFLYEEKGIEIDKSFKKSKFLQEYDNQDPEEGDIALTEEEVRTLVELRDQLKVKSFDFQAHKYKKNIVSLQRKQFNIKKENLIKTLDCFLFMIATGQYHSDIMGSTITISRNGQTSHLNYRRTKNNSLCKAIPIIDDGVFISKQIIDQYQIKTKSNFPLNLSRTHFVRHLRRISEYAGFDFELNNKMARKTFASILFYNKQMPSNYLQQMLGHKDITQTNHYLRIQDNDLANEIQKQFNRIR